VHATCGNAPIITFTLSVSHDAVSPAVSPAVSHDGLVMLHAHITIITFTLAVSRDGRCGDRDAARSCRHHHVHPLSVTRQAVVIVMLHAHCHHRGLAGAQPFLCPLRSTTHAHTHTHTHTHTDPATPAREEQTAVIVPDKRVKGEAPTFSQRSQFVANIRRSRSRCRRRSSR
jgi:hypothetical protein